MRTTINLPDDLLAAAKKRAAEMRIPLGDLIERALMRELSQTRNPPRTQTPRKLRLLIVDGGLPPGVDISSRKEMYEWFQREQERERRDQQDHTKKQEDQRER